MYETNVGILQHRRACQHPRMTLGSFQSHRRDPRSSMNNARIIRWLVSASRSFRVNQTCITDEVLNYSEWAACDVGYLYCATFPNRAARFLPLVACSSVNLELIAGKKKKDSHTGHSLSLSLIGNSTFVRIQRPVRLFF